MFVDHSVYGNLSQPERPNRTPNCFYWKQNKTKNPNISSLITTSVVSYSNWIPNRVLWDLKTKIKLLVFPLNLACFLLPPSFLQDLSTGVPPKAPHFLQLMKFYIVLNISIINTSNNFLDLPQTKKKKKKKKNSSVGSPFMYFLSIANMHTSEIL